MTRKQRTSLDPVRTAPVQAYNTNDHHDCACGAGTRHVYHCERCQQPITAESHGILTVDGNTHVSCATRAERQLYNSAPGNTTDDIVEWLKQQPRAVGIDGLTSIVDRVMARHQKQ